MKDDNKMLEQVIKFFTLVAEHVTDSKKDGEIDFEKNKEIVKHELFLGIIYI